jgi:site-specific DNA-cytosine methylase
MNRAIRKFVIRHAHLFCGLGAGAKGFNQAKSHIGTAEASFQCIGGIDNDPAAIADFTRLAGVPGTLLDLFDRDQYIAFHGKEPPREWREATTADILSAFGHQRPHVVFLSAPCKGFSGLMSEGKSRSDKYQALNRLTLRGVFLMLEAYRDDPPELVVFENVPRIASRGRHLLDQIVALLRAYGYAVAETTHDCGELGGLAQSRKRFLLVARHIEKVPPFLYEPRQRPLQAVGSVLGRMPMAGDVAAAGPMHRVPALQWKTWVRLAFVEAGKDWRSLNRLDVVDGYLRDWLIVPEDPEAWHHNVLGVRHWEQPTGTVTGNSRAMTGAFSVADPRGAADAEQYQQYGVLRFDETCGAVIGVKSPGQGRFSVADPRATVGFEGAGKYRVTSFDEAGGTVIARSDTGQGAYAVADPRHAGTAKHNNEFRIVPWNDAAGTVTGAHGTGSCVQDPRLTNQRVAGDAYVNNGHYGVVPWDGASGAVSAAAGHDNGRWSVADPRLPAASKNLVCVIRSLDGTWHRPFTTLELAALQSLVDPEAMLELDGLSDQAWRERIGNAVPPAAARAIAEEMGRTLLLAWTGQTFALGSTPIWVRNVAVALSLPTVEI